MKHSEGFFEGKKKVRIYRRSWVPESPRASVVLVHGLGEHSGRYAEVAEQLAGVGCAVHALDHRGHGKSGAPRGFVDSFSNAVDDIDHVVTEAQREQRGKKQPTFLLGHSMGGALSLSYTLKYGAKLSGLILSGPAVALDGAPPLLKPIAKILSSFSPGMGLFAVQPELVSRDASMVAAYAADPLNAHGKIPARTLGEIVKFVEWLPAGLPLVSLPLLIQHGRDDKLAGVGGSQMVFDRVGSKDKTLKIYDGLYHEIYNELPADRAVVFKDLKDWVSAHIKG